jgi:hypothetical protein
MYSKQLSLFDIDRLHVGANLPDHLLISLDQQPRLVHRFNILAAYVSELGKQINLLTYQQWFLTMHASRATSTTRRRAVE